MSWVRENLKVPGTNCSKAAGFGADKGQCGTRARATEEVHMKLVRFEDINGRETFVNPDRVNHVSDFGSGTTEINFGDKEASVFVALEVSAVASTLLKAATPS
jgi:hypothetical protein